MNGKLDRVHWDTFQKYLLIEKKYSDKQHSMYAMFSRFHILKQWFTGKKYTRQNFVLFLSEQKSRGNADSTLNKYISIGKHIASFLSITGFEDITYFYEKRRIDIEVLTSEEIQQLANLYLPYTKHIEQLNKRNKTIILLLGTCGLRISEALGIEWRDVLDGPPRILLRDTKNGQDRFCFPGKDLLAEIKSLPVFGNTVFCSYRGGKLDYQEIGCDLKRRAKKLKITKPVNPHALRHSFITIMSSRIPILDLTKLAGHSDPKTTLRYTHSNLEHLANMAYRHPLLAAGRDVNDVFDIIERTVKESVDNRMQLTTERGTGELLIKVKV